MGHCSLELSKCADSQLIVVTANLRREPDRAPLETPSGARPHAVLPSFVSCGSARPPSCPRSHFASTVDAGNRSQAAASVTTGIATAPLSPSRSRAGHERDSGVAPSRDASAGLLELPADD